MSARPFFLQQLSKFHTYLCTSNAKEDSKRETFPTHLSSPSCVGNLFSVIKCPNYNDFHLDDEKSIELKEQELNRFMDETSYYFHAGLRHVYPYFSTFNVSVKERWVGQTLDHAFTHSFYAIKNLNWVDRDVKNGTLTVNGCTTSKDHILTFKDKIQHTIHRHELPVLDLKFNILHIDPHVIIINKPPSLPIHPTGRYQHNSILKIVARELQMPVLYTTHRLDMGTSGVLIFARSKSAAQFFHQEISSRKVSKLYVARVIGRFPSGTIDCDQPLAPIDQKTRIMKVSTEGKPSKSTFQTLGYSSKTNTSVVLCKPHTGRTHQLRVHLQYLGFPIHNDPLYNNPVFGDHRAKYGKIFSSPSTIIKAWEIERSRWSDKPEKIQPYEVVLDPWSETAKQTFVDPVKAFVGPDCETCPLHLIVNKTDLGFHLHALEYRGSDWSFSSPLPDWANPDWEE